MSKTATTTSFVIVTQGGALELAEGSEGKFKSFWKMIAGYGDFVDPRGSREPMRLDKEWGQQIVDNFKKGPITKVPVPLGHPQTSTELAEKNKGWLKDAEARDDGLYGLIEIRDSKTAHDIENGLVDDTSVAFDDQYVDKRSGKVFRNVLKHVGLVVDPYIKGMTQFEPALSDNSGAAFLFSDSVQENGDKNNDKEEITMSKVKNDRKFEVTLKYTEDGKEKESKLAPGAELEVPEDQAEATQKQVADAAAPKGGAELSEQQKKEQEIADREAAVAKREAELSEKTSEAEYQRLLSEGKVVPAQKEAFIALSSQSNVTIQLSDNVEKSVSTLLSEFLSKMPKGFKLSEEEGVSGGDKDKDNVELTGEEKSLTGFGVSEDDLKETKKLEGDK